ncbi:MAG: bifunctional UDP-N-acetylglucosamine diphosphorylase/glucosamine-1-phosphate N-acetyltransferase GlmU [Halanaerobacter sp.]
MTDLAVITLAAGKGTRMKSKLPKVLHQVAGKSMAQHIVDTAADLSPQHNVVVVGYKAEKVRSSITGNLDFVTQQEQLGTGHAVMQTQETLADFSGTILVLYGDTPLLTQDTLSELIKEHEEKKAAASILTTELDDPSGYGRIVRDESGTVQEIIEDKDTTAKQAKIKEINTGICCFNSDLLWSALDELDTDNAQGEYYLTDVIGILALKGEFVAGVRANSMRETIGVNTRSHLAKAEKILRTRTCEEHMANGVTIIDPDSTYIDSTVEIGRDTIIYPNSFLEGRTKIARDVVIGPQSRIVDSTIGTGVEIENSTIKESEVQANTVVGPYAHLRPGSKIGKEVKVGDYVEIKQSTISDGAKVPHLSYIGDTEIGENTNIGAGTITANYDGKKKHRTEISSNCFVGSNSTLIAPLKLAKGAITAAGAVVTKDVEEGQLVLGVPAKPKDKNK